MPSRDTTPEARAAQLAAWRRMGGAGRVEFAWELSECARESSIEGLMRSAPGLSRVEARARLLRRLLGPALFDAAYPEMRSPR